MESDASIQCNDCFCGPCRKPPYFPRTAEGVYDMLMSNALGIDTLVFIQSTMYSIWLLFTLIQGFALYNGNPGPSTVSNVAWWAVIEFIVLQLGARSTGYKLNLSSDMTVLELSVSNSKKFLLFYIIMLCLAVVANIVHIALLIAELVGGSGTLSTTNPVFGWVFLGVLVVILIVDVFLAVRAAIYRSNMNYANVLDDTGLLFALGRDKSDKTPATPATANQIGVPLLDRVKRKPRRVQ